VKLVYRPVVFKIVNYFGNLISNKQHLVVSNSPLFLSLQLLDPVRTVSSDPAYHLPRRIATVLNDNL
jgi:hypothetical protein